MWFPIASLSITAGLALFAALWAGSWRTRERRTILELQTLLERLPDDDPAKARLSKHLSRRVWRYMDHERVTKRVPARAFAFLVIVLAGALIWASPFVAEIWLDVPAWVLNLVPAIGTVVAVLGAAPVMLSGVRPADAWPNSWIFRKPED